jgi:N-methylhydantoinase B
MRHGRGQTPAVAKNAEGSGAVNLPAPDPAKVRDLGDEEFAARYRCDRFTATVLANRFGYVVEHMCARLLTTAFSPILRDFYDFAATVTGPPGLDYPTPAMSNTIVLFTGVMTESVRATIEEYGVDRLDPGDVIVANDPYRGGTHVNDLLFSRPVFHEGRVAGFVNMKAHQLDMGGVVPGGFTLTKRNIYEDGIVISPRPLIKGGEPVAETWSLIFDNVRFGPILFPDMQSVCAELELGDRLLTETIERYGVGAVHGAMEYVCDTSAERISRALEAIPDGEWEGEDVVDCDALDDSEEYRVRVKVRKRRGRAEVDFSGTSRQARTCINCTALDVKTTVGLAFKYLFDPRGPVTSGMTRHVDLVIPEGSVICALPPDGAVFAYWEQSQVMISAVLRALARAVGPAAMAGDRGGADIHNANGVLPDGTPWVSVAQCGGEIGPYGANRHGDADSQMLSYQANGIAPAAEAIESGGPVVVLRHEIVPDTGGAGYNRGGNAVVRDSLWLQPAEHHIMSLRYKRATGFGVEGGQDGTTGGIWLWPPRAPELGELSYRDATPVAGVLDSETNAPRRDGRYVYPYRVPSWESEAMSILRYLTNGGGGWGDPLDREPERVRRDVRDGYVTIAGAARDYGVVVRGDPEEDPEGLELDLEATEHLRREARAARGEP